MGSNTSVLCSYKQTQGHGGNRMVGTICAALRDEHSVDAEQHHTEKVGKDGTKCHPEWWEYWKRHADNADYVIVFDSDQKDSNGINYAKSDSCQKELNYCQRAKQGKYIRVGKYMDQNKTGKEIAQIIMQSM